MVRVEREIVREGGEEAVGGICVKEGGKETSTVGLSLEAVGKGGGEERVVGIWPSARASSTTILQPRFR